MNKQITAFQAPKIILNSVFIICLFSAISFSAQGITHNVNVDQTVTSNNGSWISMGKYNFTTGNSGYLKISNTATTGYVCADAVKFVPATTGLEIIMDNSDATGVVITGTWTVTTFATGMYYGKDYLHDGNAGKGTAGITYIPTILNPGVYEVFVRWVGSSNRSNKVPFEIGGVTYVPPTAPMNLEVSNLKTTQFTLSWNTVSGNSITYDVYNDGNLYANTTSTNINIVSLQSNKSYSMTVKAKDAVAGYSDLSTALVVNTPAQSPNVNYPPTFGNILSKIYTGRGQQVLIVPGIDDGDDAKSQLIEFSAKSLDETKLTIDSVVYHSPYRVAFIYVKDYSKLGSVDVQLKVKDNGGISIEGVDLDSLVMIQKLNITSYSDSAANFVEYDTKSWEPRPTSADLPTTESYIKTKETNSPIENKARDFFWSKMYGYIIPTITDYYIFQGYSNEGFSLFINTTDGISKDPANLTTLVENTGTTFISTSYLMEAGKAYYFEAYSKDIVMSQPFWIKWTSGSIPLQFIKNENLSVDFDITQPTTPTNFKVSNLGVNDITLKWDASSDNKKVVGYNVYVDGIKQDTLITSTEYMVKNLNPQSTYSIFVVALDAYFNTSKPSKLINTTTYSIDNTAPSIPQNITSDITTAFGVKLHWNKSNDAETQVRGYNLYQNGTKIMTNISDSFVFVGNLSQLTSYSFAVSAVDANYNESAQSQAYSVNTVAFDPNDTRDGVKKGRLIVNLKPLCKFNGFGVGVEYSKTSLLSNNLVTYGGFEHVKYDTLTNTANLKYFDKSVTDASFTRTADTHDGGKWCAKISSLANGYLRTTITSQLDQRYTYLLRFDLKKGTGYAGDVKIQLKSQFSGTPEFAIKAVTPSTDWQTFEVELNTSYSGTNTVWYLDFISLTPGDLYYDNIQFVNKAAYKAGSPYSEIGVNLLRELKPSAIRWGGIPANLLSFKDCSGKGGSEANFSYGQFVNLANKLNAQTFIETGIDKTTDYKKDSTVFRNLIEYLGSDASTFGGALRQSEGYNNLVSQSKGIMLGLGNEVWGGSTASPSHYSPFDATNYNKYGIWARAASTIIKNASGYDSKIKTAYSGRNPGLNYGLHALMIAGDDNSNVDALALAGYLGGNMNLSPEISLGTSQLDYYKSGFEMMQTMFSGLQNDWKEVLTLTNGRLLPFYFYEGNQTTNSYYGRVGQAISFADYYASVPLYGVPYTAIFTLKGGQYSLIKDEITYKKTPLFEVTKFINNYCTGTLLETKLITSDKIYSGANTLTLDPVGCKAYTDTTSYSVAMFSRDFENDYKIQLDLPDNIGNSSKCKIYTLHSNSFNDSEIMVDSVSLTNFNDSMLVNVPKYSLVIVRFDGIDQHYNAPITTYTGMKQVQSIKLSVYASPYLPQITKNKGNVRLRLTCLPTDALVNTAKWQILDNTTIGAYLKETLNGQYVWSTGLNSGNGTVRVVATTLDGTNLSDTISITISNQGPTSFENLMENNLQIFPVPVYDILKLKLLEPKVGKISIIDLNGKIQIVQKMYEQQSYIDVSKLKEGVYIIKIEMESCCSVLKFSKI